MAATLCAHASGHFVKQEQWERWWADDGGSEGPQRGAVGAKRRSAVELGSGEGRRSPFPVWGNLSCKYVHFRAVFCAESKAACSKFGNVIVQ